MFLAACGSKQTAPAPKHTPVNSPEASTACPEQWKAAKKAREVALEVGTQAARSRAASAVFSHAECEHAVFDGLAFAGPTHERLLSKIRSGRGVYQTTRNLYNEVPNYGDARAAVGARARLGELNGKFADKLRAVRTPKDMTSTAEKAMFLSQLSALGRGFDRSASVAFAGAIKTARTDFGGKLTDDLRKWVKRACTGLHLVDENNAERKHCPALLSN